jgi:endonuclease III
MATSQRQQALTRLQKQLKQHHKPIVPDVGRPVLEQVLFACCLENTPYDVAERAFARLGESFFDYNEVRVTTVTELAETLRDLPFPQRSALGLRRVLQAVFESSYSFSLEHARKQSIAAGIKSLEQLHGIPPFVVSFVASTCLGGHMIPLDDGALAVLFLAGVIGREEYDSGKVPWLERAIPKKQGVEFSSLLHQFGAEVLRNIHAPLVRKLLLAVDPQAKDRLPKRGEPISPRNPPPEPQGKDAKRAAEAAEDLRPAGPQAASRPAGKTPMPSPSPKTGKPGPKPFVVKPNVGRPLTIKPETESREAGAGEPVSGQAAAKSPPAPVRPTKAVPPARDEPAAKSARARPPAAGKPPARGSKVTPAARSAGPRAGAGSRAAEDKKPPAEKKSAGKPVGGGRSAGRSKPVPRDGTAAGKAGRSGPKAGGRKGAVSELSKKKPR